jgi:hypothetical protein
MSRTSAVVWSLIGAVAVIVGILGAVYGPNLYREGKALVGPIVEMSRSEERLAELNVKLPFVEPADGDVAEERFLVFLAIRRELLPRYRQWKDVARQLERNGSEDWEAAKGALDVVQQVMNAQVETLRAHAMSPAEFNWIEDLTYGTWMTGVHDAIGRSAVSESLRQTTAGDLEVLAELVRRYGPSESSRRFATHLKGRLDTLDNPEPPSVDGVSERCSAIFWEHRDELVELDLAGYAELHRAIRGAGDVNIRIDGE